jgi:hypothetical protein
MPLADMSASPSLGCSTSGSIPARRSASAPGRTSPAYSALPMPMATVAMPAICGRSPVPTDPVWDTTGWTPAFSIAASVSATRGLAPEPPRAIPLRRTSSAARTSPVGSAGPIPPAWVRTSSCCARRSWSSGSRVSFMWPTPVVEP